MVKIVDYAVSKNSKGEEFFALIVQGELEAVISDKTKQTYFTARTARVASTFNEHTCKSLIGTELPGKITKVLVEPYEYTVPETGEIVTLKHSWRYLNEEDAIIQNQVLENSEVF